MQSQDVSADFLVKFWPWLEANGKRLIVIGVAVLVALFVWYYLAMHKQQQEMAAGQAYTEFQLNQAPSVQSEQVVGGYLKIAQDYAGTLAGQRAQLQAALTLFDGGKYADAEKQFENFLSANSGSSLAASAQNGVAASLEAQGKLDQALTAYRAVTTTYPDSTVAIEAKYSCGRVLELQGKLSEAESAYKDVTQTQLAGSLASIAHLRMTEIQAKLATQKPVQTTQPASKS